MIADTERELIATLMQRPGDCWGVELAPENFETEQHADLFSRIRELTADSQPADPVSVADSFERDGKRALATLALRLASEAQTTTQPAVFAERVRMAWRLRQRSALPSPRA